MSLQHYFQSIVDRLQGSATVKTVYGDPITAEGKTIIPVAKVGYCFAIGMGPATLRKEGEQRTEGKETGGTGGGFRAKPLGVIEVTKEETKFIPIDDRGKLAGTLLIGLLLGLLMAGRRSRR
jgi:uncharacterized spore protein YtfJ